MLIRHFATYNKLDFRPREMNKASGAILSALYAALICGASFFALGVCAAFFTNGEEQAPGFTYSMLALVDIPVKLMGFTKQGTLLPASAFWGVVAGIVVFFYKLIFPKKNGVGT
jgi:hypothetical protein